MCQYLQTTTARNALRRQIIVTFGYGLTMLNKRVSASTKSLVVLDEIAAAHSGGMKLALKMALAKHEIVFLSHLLPGEKVGRKGLWSLPRLARGIVSLLLQL